MAANGTEALKCAGVIGARLAELAALWAERCVGGTPAQIGHGHILIGHLNEAIRTMKHLSRPAKAAGTATDPS